MSIRFILLFITFVHCDIPLDIPKFSIDLDLDPIDRWSIVIPNFDEPMREFKDEIRKQVPQIFIDAAEIIGGRLDKHIPQPYHDEIYSIA